MATHHLYVVGLSQAIFLSRNAAQKVASQSDQKDQIKTWPANTFFPVMRIAALWKSGVNFDASDTCTSTYLRKVFKKHGLITKLISMNIHLHVEDLIEYRIYLPAIHIYKINKRSRNGQKQNEWRVLRRRNLWKAIISQNVYETKAIYPNRYWDFIFHIMNSLL